MESKGSAEVNKHFIIVDENEDGLGEGKGGEAEGNKDALEHQTASDSLLQSSDLARSTRAASTKSQAEVLVHR